MKLSSSEFEKLALEQLDMLYRVARRMARDPGEAEDLVQETYVRALRARGSFDLQEYGIRPWLLRIMRNLHLNRAQRGGRAPQLVEAELLDASPAQNGAESLPLDPRSFENMDQNLVRAVEALPQEYSSVLLLWALDELSYKEIAEALDIPVGTVMSRLHRARAKVAEQLRAYAVEEGIIRE